MPRRTQTPWSNAGTSRNDAPVHITGDVATLLDEAANADWSACANGFTGGQPVLLAPDLAEAPMQAAIADPPCARSRVPGGASCG